MTTGEREPEALPAEARAWLDDYVVVRSMPRASFVRVGRAIATPRISAARPAQRTAWIVAAVLIAAAVLLVIGSRLFVGREVVADASDPHALAEDRADTRTPEQASARTPDPTPAELPPVAPRPISVPSPTATPRPEATRAPSNATVIVTPSTTSLSAERELLQIAWDALAAGDGKHAKAIAQRHRAEFPAGQLTDVRDAIDALVRCAAATATNRPAILAAFERAHRHSTALGRVRDGCRAD